MIPIQLLRKVSAFEELSDSQLQKLADLCGEETCAAGTTLFKEGDPAEQLYVLREGRIALELGMRI